MNIRPDVLSIISDAQTPSLSNFPVRTTPPGTRFTDQLHFSKYQYINGIRLDPLNITKDLIYFSLDYVTGGSKSHLDPIISEFPNFSYYSCEIVTFGQNLYGVIYHIKV